MITVPFKISIILLLIYGVIASLTATVFLPQIFSTLESTVYTVATRSQAFGLDPEQLDHRINKINENNFVFSSTPTQNNSRSTRQITYLESRTKLPVQTVTSAYGSFFVEMSGETVGIYHQNEEEELLVSCLNQGPAVVFKLYLICSVLFVFGGVLSNLEGVLHQQYEAEEEQQVENAIVASVMVAQNHGDQIGVQNCGNAGLNGQNQSFQNPNFQNPNFQSPNFQNPNFQNQNFQNSNAQNSNIQDTNFQNPISQPTNQQNLTCCAKLTDKIDSITKVGVFYHFGSVLISVMAVTIPISLVFVLQSWAKHNSVNTLRQASSANNMTYTDPVYIFYLLVSTLPMLAYLVTSCWVPCGLVTGRIRKNPEFEQRQGEVQRQLVF